MTLKKLATICGIVLGIIVLMAGGATLLVRYIISPDMVRKTVIPRVGNALQRHVEIGDVQIGIFKGISLSDLKLYERDGKGVFVSLSKAHLRYQLLPLLSRRVVVDEIVLDSPHVSIVRNLDGTFNFSDLLKKGKTQESEKEKTAISFAVARFSVSDGRVTLNDRKGVTGTPFTYGIGAIVIKAKEFTLERPFTIKLSAAIPGASLGFDGSAEFAKTGPAVNGELTVSDCDLARVASGLPAGISGKVQTFAPEGTVTAKVRLAGAVKAPLAMLQAGEIQLKEVRLATGSSPTALSGALVLSGGSIVSRDLVVDLGKGRLSIQLKTSPLEKRPFNIELSASSEAIDLDAAAVPGKVEKGASQPAPPHGREAGPLNLPLTAVGSVRVGVLKYHGLNISGLSLRYRLADNNLDVDELKGNVAGGKFSDSTRVNLALPGFSYTTSLSLTGIQAEMLAGAFAPKAAGSISGALSARAVLSGSGTMPATVKKNLAGSGGFDIKNGKLTGTGFIGTLAGFLGSEELRVVRFRTFNGTYRIGGEQVMLDAQLDGSDIMMKAKGRVGFDKSLDMSLDTRIAPPLITGKVAQGAAGNFITDEQGWGVLPLQARGTVASPRFSLSAAGVGRRIKEKAGEAIRNEVGRKLLKREGAGNQEEPLGKAIRGLFGN
jgi:AsmA protein